MKLCLAHTITTVQILQSPSQDNFRYTDLVNFHRIIGSNEDRRSVYALIFRTWQVFFGRIGEQQRGHYMGDESIFRPTASTSNQHNHEDFTLQHFYVSL